MAKAITRERAVSGLVWTLLERCGNQGVHFIVSVVLARLLMPSIFGTIAIINVFTGLMGIFINFGFGSALIQKKDADDLDYSSVFYFNLFSGLIIYLILFFCAPLIANFYSDPTLTMYIRVYSIALVVGSVKSIQQIYIRKHYQFQKFFWATLGGTIMAAILGIWMAYRGFGAWALIGQSLLNLVVDTAILWLTVQWHPQFIFSFKRLVALFDYGGKMLAANILDTLYGKLRTLLIGRYYSMSDLAFYHKGLALPQMVITNINGSINSVLFPSMSAIQDDKSALRTYTRRAIKSSTYLILPAMVILAAAGDSIVLLLLTEKWLPSIFFLRIACLTYAFYPVNSANLCAIKALGRSDIFIRLEIFKKIVGLVLLFSTLWISVKAVALSAIAASVFNQIINTYPNKKLLDYSYLEQLKDMCPQILLSLATGCVVYSFVFFHWNPWLTLFVQLSAGGIFYIAVSWLFHLESFEYSVGFARNALAKISGKFQKRKSA